MVKSPCIGICTSTSLGDRVCRGCKRRDYEVIGWNQYSDGQKLKIIDRIKGVICTYGMG